MGLEVVAFEPCGLGLQGRCLNVIALGESHIGESHIDR